MKYGGGHTGNVCTEDLVFMCDEVGIETGVDLDALVDAAAAAAARGEPLAVALGLSMMRQVASTSSLRLWGGMLVVMPTAMPVEPFISRWGKAHGRTVGSVVDSL